jgi:hypothetical protein
MPDFFIAGVPKAGTTALHVALARHPALYMSAVKEPKFFLTDGPPSAQGGPGDHQCTDAAESQTIRCASSSGHDSAQESR